MADFLKCDAENCDHEEVCSDYGPNLIGKACPECGASLLTQKDFDDYQPIFEMMESLKRAGLVSADPDARGIRLRLNQHAGELNVRIDSKAGEQ